ncbi:ATP-binding protein [Maribacter sp. TH_r10]|uniref:AAA family ATPase n=1 Tax=Maribacter luteus TaxID=2594478 RepID=A0A6I2MU15_9FLAO|nr:MULTISPECIES: ATP-binding protein [Maribacter]MDV7138971.1 ATP-binding protein [Maribacter sp. TH_r10]MRX64926.1 AAA family ATPase [Maribacter luteus]
MKAKKIVITGGPSTGKTSVIEQLEKDGFHCLHEVIRDMTLEEKTQGQEMKMVSNPIVSVPDPKSFNLNILNARINQYHSALKSTREIVFFDRGIPDVLAYMDCFEQTYESDFSEPCRTLRYDHIFLMPPWKEIHVTDNERFESFEESLKIHDCLAKSYGNFSYDVTHVPKGSVKERVRFILDQINSI